MTTAGQHRFSIGDRVDVTVPRSCDGYASEHLALAAMAQRGEFPGVPLTDSQAYAHGLPVRVDGEFVKGMRAERKRRRIEQENQG